MTSYVEVLDPTGVTRQKNIQASAGTGDLNGKNIGFIDNGNPNYDIFLTRLVELLNKKFTFSGVTHVKKKEKDTGVALGSVEIEKLIKDCDIVLNGICD